MDKDETRRFYDQLRGELEQVIEEQETLEQRQSALQKMVEGLRELYPWITDEDEQQEESNTTVAQYLSQILQQAPSTQWFTVRDLVELLPNRTKLLDAEAAVRAALRRLESWLEKRPRDGRTQEYRWQQ